MFAFADLRRAAESSVVRRKQIFAISKPGTSFCSKVVVIVCHCDPSLGIRSYLPISLRRPPQELAGGERVVSEADLKQDGVVGKGVL